MGVLVAAAVLVMAADARSDDRLAIVTTTTDLRSLVEAVGGDRVSVVSLVPPQLDPEDYQPKPQDVARLKQARMVVRVGLDFDVWFDRLLQQTGIGRRDPRYVDTSFAIAPLEVRGATVGPGDGHAHGSGNPHYWLDPKNADIVTGNILEALVRVDPHNAFGYEANRLAFLKRLDGKLTEWEGKLASFANVPLVSYHNTWAYFARRFRLDFVGFIEPRPGVPPSPFQLSSIIKTIQARKVPIIVRAAHEPERHAAFVAKRTNIAIAVLAASVGALPQATDYLSLFDANVAALLAAKAGPKTGPKAGPRIEP